MLIAPGSSLGGARPKANVSDPDGNLWIAKFPSNSDEIDMGAWEMVVHELAAAAGLKGAPAKLMQLSGKHHTFLTRRFDREGADTRIHFASAMTLLAQQDGADYQSGVSYLDLAAFIVQHGSQVNANLEELWKRIAFNIMVRNTDDHLCNHGFTLTSQGWELSPAYDMNATPFGTGLTLNISDDDSSLDLDLVREVAPYFRVTKTAVERIMVSMTEVVSGWKNVAAKYKLSKAAQDYIWPAFEQG
jgi:serine/threonine-protein kinase HipA